MVSIFADKETLSHEAARFIVRVAAEATAARGHFMLSLSGGTTPRVLYGLLAEEPYRSQIDWSKVHIFWSDERCVPPDNSESNFHLAQEVLLSHLALDAAQIHRVPADSANREQASLDYTEEMRRVFGASGVPVFDLHQLGMGPEGHTASLFPHQASLKETERLVMPVSVPKPPPDRLTFTPPLLNAARHVLFLVTGADKADAVKAVIEGEYQPDEYPAQIVRPPRGETTWMVDSAAGAKLAQQTH